MKSLLLVLTFTISVVLFADRTIVVQLAPTVNSLFKDFGPNDLQGFLWSCDIFNPQPINQTITVRAFAAGSFADNTKNTNNRSNEFPVTPNKFTLAEFESQNLAWDAGSNGSKLPKALEVIVTGDAGAVTGQCMLINHRLRNGSWGESIHSRTHTILFNKGQPF